MITIDYTDRRPLYEQIADKLAKLMLSGVFPPNEKLPSVRSLATELSVNPNTISRAYSELEREGYIYSVVGRGSFVSGTDAIIDGEKAKLTEQIQEEIKKAAGVSSNCYEIIKRKPGNLFKRLPGFLFMKENDERRCRDPCLRNRLLDCVD